MRIAPPAAVRTRSQEERRRHREQALAAHCAGARRVTLDLTRVALRRPSLFIGETIDGDELARAAGDGVELLWGERRGGEVAVVSRAPLDDPARGSSWWCSARSWRWMSRAGR
jgi:polynucleotide 5'-kinase involved in rRNA processing